MPQSYERLHVGYLQASVCSPSQSKDNGLCRAEFCKSGLMACVIDTVGLGQWLFMLMNLKMLSWGCIGHVTESLTFICGQNVLHQMVNCDNMQTTIPECHIENIAGRQQASYLFVVFLRNMVIQLCQNHWQNYCNIFKYFSTFCTLLNQSRFVIPMYYVKSCPRRIQ